MEPIVESFVKALVAVDRIAAKEIFDEHLRGNHTSENVENLLIPSLDEIGDGWAVGRYALAQVYMSSRICEELVSAAFPEGMAQEGAPTDVAIAVLEDYHMLGKRLVISILRSRGIVVRDYGRTTVEELAARCVEDKVRVLLISVLMLNSALHVRRLKDDLKKRGADVKIIVGGAPFRIDENLYIEVGADAMCRIASEAERAIKKVLEASHAG